jgi:hypothetical protein
MSEVYYFLEWLIKFLLSLCKGVPKMISPTTQALIDTAEAEIPITAGLVSKVSGDAVALAGDQSTLSADQQALQTQQAKQMTESIAALNALATDLGVPGISFTPPPAAPVLPVGTGSEARKVIEDENKAKTRVMRAIASNPRVAYALSLGIDWGQILQAILNAGLPALEALIQKILAGLGAGVPPTPPATEPAHAHSHAHAKVHK